MTYDEYLMQMMGVRNNEAPPVPAPVAGGGYEFPNDQGQRVAPAPVAPYAAMPNQLGGLFGSTNTTTITDPMQQQAMMMLLLLMGSARPNAPSGGGSLAFMQTPSPAPYFGPENGWVQFEDGSWGQR
jgi:hypothetical protein